MPSDLNLHGHRKLLVGFSGGLDSTVLLHQLSQLRFRQSLSLRAIYIHHGLSQHADQWLVHCRRVCAELEIPFVSRNVQLLGEKGGIEAEARSLRYATFKQVLDPDEALVTAHHQDDQCETFLLALKRGSGPAGLSSMPSMRKLGNHWHLRPLLHVSRQELEQYATSHHLSWIDDESNQDDYYDRNFLRLRILPRLMQRWPQFSRSVTRSAELCAEQERLLDELLASDLQQCVADNGSIDIGYLADATEQKRNALLRRWLSHRGSMTPSREALTRLWQEVALSRDDANPQLLIGNKSLRRYQQRLYLSRMFPALRGTRFSWQSASTPLVLPNGLGTLRLTATNSQGLRLRTPTDEESMTVRFGQSAYLHLVTRQGGRSLKKIWQEKAIPVWLRENIPLIYFNEELVCAPGIFMTQAGVSKKGEGYAVVWEGIDPELKPWIHFSSGEETNFE
ncbi:tRNA lysidine(34) synthetase TilS [Rosenbergiella epipactidis]|uniref:tRNA lysidine(34) synthetase TilS n=1 Tax=Rosenbergiella epipactidis TaxID=1544694 RepID=UPI001F4E7DC1|nr:tRNA lysidine(34) synthetase TilS [Rosenbergiella epipactidis]